VFGREDKDFQAGIGKMFRTWTVHRRKRFTLRQMEKYHRRRRAGLQEGAPKITQKRNLRSDQRFGLRGMSMRDREGCHLYNRFVLGLTLGAAFGGLVGSFTLTPPVGILIGAIIGLSCGMILHVSLM
jgi:F0F1-type ATP synthase assembly protein I